MKINKSLFRHAEY